METPTPTAVDGSLFRHPRIFGIVILALGLLLAKWQIYDPLHAAEQHIQRVELYTELVFLAIFLPGFGGLMTLFGMKPMQWFKINPQNLSLKNTLILLSSAAVCLAALLFVIAQLERQGYVMKF
ncbi:MAG: hypothetical protein ABSG86_03805 [Thermoguttaceae bacterium]|jgi:hypothetical protein